MPRTHPLEALLTTCWRTADWQEVTVLVAVSGGADSVALLRALARLKTAGVGRLVVGHYNHRLRGASSDADEQFVAEQCHSLQIDCRMDRAEPWRCDSRGDGVEAAARAARYDFLLRTAEQLGARYVVTAHTANDQAETVLHHIVRGTGLTGLAGIPRTRSLSAAVTLLRPLLTATRQQVLEYLAALGQGYCEDETNDELQFTRNRIRHELLPLLTREYSSSVVESLVRLGTLAADAQRVIDRMIDDLLARAVVRRDDRRLTLDCQVLAGADRHLVREVFVAVWRQQTWPLQSMGFVQWNLLADMALGVGNADRNAVSRRDFPGAVSAQREGEQLVLALLEESVACISPPA